ncbi:hypothetical protein [uncultured Tenacibaculum sp.]|uniref:hypothetical protein n=1 Tax=uncultured Tenacibaculum sp. TaxID=174713 RepID=UPI0026259D36|nr:hypothetical protein [uncultured Tenacibaculum sp.]
MKVKFNFSVDQVLAINALLNKVSKLNFNALNTDEKIEYSIAISLSDTFESKKRTLQKNNNLFDIHKKVKMTLNYHEAWGLRNIFINRIGLLENEFQKFNIQSSISLIDSNAYQL